MAPDALVTLRCGLLPQWMDGWNVGHSLQKQVSVMSMNLSAKLDDLQRGDHMETTVALCEIRTQLQELTKSVESCQSEVSEVSFTIVELRLSIVVVASSSVTITAWWCWRADGDVPLFLFRKLNHEQITDNPRLDQASAAVFGQMLIRADALSHTTQREAKALYL